MKNIKTKSIEAIEQKMQGVEENSLRYHILESAKNFKTSWVDLGQSLYSVWRDKLFKEWGFNQFDAYVSKEIGIRKQTAMKLLKSYYFLEKEEPQYLKEDYVESADAASVPGYESIDLLRQARNKKELDSEDYNNLKEEIFQKGKDFREVKKGLTALIRERKELDPEEAREKRRLSTLKRFLSTLVSLKREIEADKLLPSTIVRDTADLIKRIESEIG
jgi:regulator of replication initiation timing